MTKEIYPHFLASEIAQGELGQSKFEIINVPYEETVSYCGGTAKGPKAILEASDQLELWVGTRNPVAKGVHTHQPIDCKQDFSAILQDIKNSVTAAVERQAIPIMLGGEHSVTYGAILGLLEAGESDFAVIQFDAHADLRDNYEGSPYSHACVMKRVFDHNIPIHQIGVRAYCHEEQQLRESNPLISYQDAREICRNDIRELRLPANFPKKVYLTVDIDGLDSSIMPATGTPVPGGLSYWQFRDILKDIGEYCEIIGMDLVEFAPIENFHAYDYLAADVLYRMMAAANSQ